MLTPPSASPGIGMSSTQTYVARPPDFRWDFAMSGSVKFRMVAVLRGAEAVICVDGDMTGTTTGSATTGCYAMPIEHTPQKLNAPKVSPLESVLTAEKGKEVTDPPRGAIAARDPRLDPGDC